MSENNLIVRLSATMSGRMAGSSTSLFTNSSRGRREGTDKVATMFNIWCGVAAMIDGRKVKLP